MTWILLACLAAALCVGLVLARREELARMADAVAARERAERAGASAARLQHPVVDLSRCLGCGTCVAACPEDGVLELVHGQAVVVRSARCVGVAACERECPVGAITVTIANLSERSDVPAVDERLEAVGSPGIFLAGEVTALALVRTAIEHGVRVAREVALRVAGTPPIDALDLVVVGAGPAGMAASLEAKRLGLASVTLEQELGPGGTVAKYPRGKLVVNEPIELPLFGRLKRNAYRKEELVALWTELAERHALEIKYGERYERIERDAATGLYTVWSTGGAYLARNVLFAVGRRGSPRKLGVPGEELEKVSYAVADASQHTARRVLVVGGGDAAVEAALGLAEQPGNHVTLSYRRDEFFRLRARNSARLEAALATRAIEVLRRSEVVAITPDTVELALAQGPSITKRTLANDEVIVLAGGTPPVQILEAAGVSFDPRARPQPRAATSDAHAAGDTGGGALVRPLAAALALTLLFAAFALWHRDYYFADAAARATHAKHDLLRPGRGLGLVFGCLATALVSANLAYLLRRGARLGVTFGSLRAWMSVHVATGVLALLCGALHSAMAPGHTVGGHALLALAVLAVTGGVGRYFYASVPRAANGRELALEEVRGRLDGDATEGLDSFAAEARSEVLELARRRQWGGNLAGRIAALCGVKLDLRRALRHVSARGAARGVERARIDEALAVARRAHRLALEAAHLEDLRALLSGWRWLHRWVTVLMLALVLLHVAHAAIYGGAFESALEALDQAWGGARAT